MSDDETTCPLYRSDAMIPPHIEEAEKAEMYAKAMIAFTNFALKLVPKEKVLEILDGEIKRVRDDDEADRSAKRTRVES
jgi:hypothetical protein